MRSTCSGPVSLRSLQPEVEDMLGSLLHYQQSQLFARSGMVCTIPTTGCGLLGPCLLKIGRGHADAELPGVWVAVMTKCRCLCICR